MREVVLYVRENHEDGFWVDMGKDENQIEMEYLEDYIPYKKRVNLLFDINSEKYIPIYYTLFKREDITGALLSVICKIKEEDFLELLKQKFMFLRMIGVLTEIRIKEKEIVELRKDLL